MNKQVLKKKGGMLKLLQFILCYIPVLAVQLFSSWITFTSVRSWYPTLVKPSWNPPDWVFGPVWTLLYLSMGYALFLLCRSPAPFAQKKTAYLLFFAQLLCNGLWSLLFFGLRSPGLALADLALLLLLLLLAIRQWMRFSFAGGALLIPYLLWSLYAASLNGAILFLNW